MRRHESGVRLSMSKMYFVVPVHRRMASTSFREVPEEDEEDEDEKRDDEDENEEEGDGYSVAFETVDRSELQRVYSDKTDDELLALAVERKSLEPEAQSLLWDELQRRKLTDPHLVHPNALDEMSG
jgi:hypothetical protein